jgi:hypothetical protein
MEMSLIHAGLAAGVGLAAVPILLHLFMRQTPKHVVFPALRLIRERQRQSKKRLRIKNWLLLLARMAILALMALALARPRLYSQVPLGDDSTPRALGLVFDTSLSMKYKDKDKTRLDEAKERARELIRKLPESSLVFVVDSAVPGVPVGLPPSAAQKIVDGLAIHPVNRPLNAAMGQVYAAVTDCELPVHIVYVLTDLARSAWDPEKPAEGIERLAKAKKGPDRARTQTFVLRLAPPDFHNVAVDAAEPSIHEVPIGESVEIKSKIRSQGPAAVKRMAEFWLDGKKKDEKPIEIAPDGQAEVRFMTPPRLQDGEFHHGIVKLTGTPDPLEDDDARYFTFKVRPPLKVLVLSDLVIDAVFVSDVLDPDPAAVSRPVVVERGKAADLGERYRDGLQNYVGVFLLNVATLDEGGWGALNRYVHDGGGLVVAPGHRSVAENYNGPTAAQLLPAELLTKKLVPPETTFGKISDISHPLFERGGKDLAAQLGLAPIFRYWTVKQNEGNAVHTLLSFSDGAPALIERVFKGPKSGRVLLWTTPLCRVPVNVGEVKRRSDAWNDFPVSWPFLALMDLTVPYLAGATTEQLNPEAGESALLSLGQSSRFTNFVLTGPDPKTAPQAIPSSSSDFLEVTAPQSIGHWTVKAIAPDKTARELGFSVNAPRAESQFTALGKPDLDTIFGKDGYLLAEDAESGIKIETTAWHGHEIFPWMMLLILIVVSLENVLANTFYKEAPKVKPVGAVA